MWVGMRNPLVVLGALAVTTTVAAAEPPGLTASVAPAAAPADYVSVGAMFGGDGFLDGQIAVEGGHHLQGAWWLHGLAATGLVADDQGGGPIAQARAGIEARTCTAPKRLLCAFGGADVGHQTITWHSHEGSSMDEHHDDAIASLRAGLDLGGDNLRLRPGLETYHVLYGSDVTNGHAPLSLIGFNLTLGVAYQW